MIIYNFVYANDIIIASTVFELQRLFHICEREIETLDMFVNAKPRDAAAVLFGLKFADNIHYKFKSSQASKAML